MNSTIERILPILGGRPQLIKADILAAAIAAVNELKETVVLASQHFDANMSYVFLTDLSKDVTTMVQAMPQIGLCDA